jgi:predicted HAD superfamily Cof-like phosphohydrolase
MSDISDEFQNMVRDFHVGIGGQKQDVDLRISLIEEEANEFIDAVDEKDIIDAIDALCDLLYVTYGTADVFGISLDGSSDAAMSVVPVENWGAIWDGMSKELRSFTISIEDVVKALRMFQKFDAKEQLKSRLYEIVRGCWACASQAFGVDLRPFFREVHRTNMHKLTGPKREDGKQLKPPGWKPPRIKTMYDRLQANKSPECRLDCACITEIRQCPDGGFVCDGCGGLITGLAHE